MAATHAFRNPHQIFMEQYSDRKALRQSLIATYIIQNILGLIYIVSDTQKTLKQVNFLVKQHYFIRADVALYCDR